jgi:hypothetical protein
MISASNVNTHTVGFQQHFYQSSKALRLPTDFQMQTSTMNAIHSSLLSTTHVFIIIIIISQCRREGESSPKTHVQFYSI